jgi:sulfite reductase (NADPH) flavoprotein alpha-component
MSNLLIPESAKEKPVIKARLSNRLQLTKNDNRTYLLSLEFEEEVPFKAGDSFAIFPANSDKDVLEFLSALNLPQDLNLNSSMTAFDFLKHKVSLTKWNSKLSQLVFNEPKLPEQLQELPPIQILKTLDISMELAKELILLLPPQMPRYYSIASSPKINSRSLDLLVSLNRFEVDGKECFGLASSFLCLDSPLNASLFGFIHSAEHFRVPDENVPIIMIGPGTGVAPFRAFIQERIQNQLSKNWLFFGERNKSSDFYFEEELTSYNLEKKLTLSLAFSRDQDHKIYVQDLIYQHKEEFHEWIKEGAIIYVCGDAKNMARDVEAAIIKILAEFEKIELKEAQVMLRSLKKQKRYNLDVY